ncbi:hypothetical protein ACRAWG_24035 [Methylobacterium sp. P31]
MRLRAAGIPCGEVMGLREALTCDRAREAGLVVEAPGNAHVIAPPYRLDGQRLPVRRMPPRLGDLECGDPRGAAGVPGRGTGCADGEGGGAVGPSAGRAPPEGAKRLSDRLARGAPFHQGKGIRASSGHVRGR